MTNNKHYLTIAERAIIEYELRNHKSLRAIARNLGRPYATITTDVRKHGGRIHYMAHRAIDESRDAMRKRGAKLQMARHWDLLIYIEQNYDPKIKSLKLLLREWKQKHPEAPSLATLYSWVPKGLLGSSNESLLRPRDKATKEFKQWKRMLGRPISLRETEQTMTDFGHWEGDFVVGGNTKAKGYVLTLVEKKSRFAITHKMESTRPAETLAVMQAIIDEFGADVFKSITFDNGIEFTHLPRLEDQYPTRIYFAFPYSAWQRGQNENWNGLLRRFFPKGTDFRTITGQELMAVTNAFNNMPREILGFNTPAAIFNQNVRLN